VAAHGPCAAPCMLSWTLCVQGFGHWLAVQLALMARGRRTAECRKPETMVLSGHCQGRTYGDLSARITC
jgi:hypothetical protein